MHAYDLAILTRHADRTDPTCQGWCFGLPPGLTPAQWPLDPANGYPLKHGFTLLLPEDYRCHGPEIVALSFFASADDHNDGGPIEAAPAIRAALGSAGGPAPDDPDLVPFWHAERAAHPRLHRLEDPIGIAFAAILLTRAEFDGPLCRPPPLSGSGHLGTLPPPRWMAVGAAAAYWEFQSHMRVVRDMFGEQPAEDLAWDRALVWTERACDPNAGKVPFDPHLGEPTDYQQPRTRVRDETGEDVYHDQAWAENHASNHIGGTMRPVQWVPRFSPYYVEFDEQLGGYNFGDGNAQLDVRDMKFDWACG